MDAFSGLFGNPLNTDSFSACPDMLQLREAVIALRPFAEIHTIEDLRKFLVSEIFKQFLDAIENKYNPWTLLAIFNLADICKVPIDCGTLYDCEEAEDEDLPIIFSAIAQIPLLNDLDGSTINDNAELNSACFARDLMAFVVRSSYVRYGNPDSLVNLPEILRSVSTSTERKFQMFSILRVFISHALSTTGETV